MTVAIPADPLYIAARHVLLDALDALHNHRDAVILVGAQAIYLQAGDADLEVSVAPYTADADLSIDPSHIGGDPRIIDAMTGAGFILKESSGGGIEPGTWLATTKVAGESIVVPVDLLVPERLAPARTKRDARLPDHGKNATRWTPGIEATILDNTPMRIPSLDPHADPRVTTVRVAGPAALLIAKCHKIAERLADGDHGRSHRIKPKDCGDVIRIMRFSSSPTAIGAQLAALAADPVCGLSVIKGVEYLHQLFSSPRSRGVDLAVTALAGALPENLLRELAPSYVTALLAAYQH